MPRLDPYTQLEIPRPQLPVEEDPVPKPWGSSIAAGMARQNPLFKVGEEFSAFAFGGEDFNLFPDFPMQDGYYASDDPEIEGYPIESFVKSRSPEETVHIKKNIDRDRLLTERAGITGEILGAVTNPILLGAATLTGGTSIPGMMAIEGGAELISETILHSQQPLRTKTESALNVGLAAGITGVLGGVGKALSAEPPVAGGPGAVEDFGPRIGVGRDSAGAQRAFETTAADETMVGGKVAEVVAQGPGARLAAARNPEATALYQRLADTPFIFQKYKEGRTFGPSVEAQLGKYDGLAFSGQEQLYKQRALYNTKNPNSVLNKVEFSEEVGKALKGGDEHLIPEVAATAKWYRSNILDPLFKEAQELNLLPGTKKYYSDAMEDAIAKGYPSPHINRLKSLMDEAPEKLIRDQSYFPRVYKIQKILEQYQPLMRKISAHIHSTVPGLSKTEADQSASEIMHSLVGTGPVDAPSLNHLADIIPTAPSLKGRTLDLPDSLMDEFLEKDAAAVIRRHSETLGREIEFAGTFSNKRLTDELSQVSDGYDKLINEAGSLKEQKSLMKEKAAVDRDLKALRDRLFHIYGRPHDPSAGLVRAGRAIRTLNAVTMLGGVTLSSLADVARPLMQYGVGPYARGIVNLVTNFKGFNLSRAEMKRWGIGLELALSDARLASMADLADDVSATNRKVMDIFGKATLLSPWNAGWKQFTGAMASNEILRVAQLAAGPSKAMTTRLARAGISPDQLKAIRQQFEEFGSTEKGIRLANTADWDDKYARDALESAVRSDVNLAIVTPGVGDAPLFMSSEVGKTVAQFKTFLMSATNRMLMNGMQRSDVAFVQGLIASISLGSLVGAIKSELGGRRTDDWTTADWVAEGIDRSGVLGIYNVPASWAKDAILDDDSTARRLGDQMFSDLIGPSGGQVKKIGKIGAEVAFGEADETTIKKAQTLAPVWNNLLHLRQLYSLAVEGPGYRD